MFTRQWKGTGIVVKKNIRPTTWGVADRTVLSKLTVMMIVLRMTGKTIFGSTPKNIIPVARHATDIYMFADKRKSSEAVVKLSTRPLCGLMTCCTVFTVLPFVNIFRSVTRETIPGSIFVYPVGVTGLTGHADM